MIAGYRILIFFVVLSPLTLLLAGCAQREVSRLDALYFSQEAKRLKALLVYEENPADLAQYEPLTAAKGWRGDCSNYAASLAASTGAIIWKGNLKDAGPHAMACLGTRCADTYYHGVFTFNPDDWTVLFKTP